MSLEATVVRDTLEAAKVALRRVVAVVVGSTKWVADDWSGWVDYVAAQEVRLAGAHAGGVRSAVADSGHARSSHCSGDWNAAVAHSASSEGSDITGGYWDLIADS